MVLKEMLGSGFLSLKLFRVLVKRFEPAIVGVFHQQSEGVGFYTCW